MSCWVAPIIAAEMWKVSVQSVLDGIQNGTIPTQMEEGFTFVDIAPDGPRFEPPRAYRKENRPPTFVLITQEEADALNDGLPNTAQVVMADELATLEAVAHAAMADELALPELLAMDAMDQAPITTQAWADDLPHEAMPMSIAPADVVSKVEAEALVGRVDVAAVMEISHEPEMSIPAQLIRDEQAEGSLSNWREIRHRAGRSRVPPQRAVA